MKHSVVIPVFNEAGNLERLHAALSPVLDALKGESEVIFVDDGSRDGSFAELQRIAHKDRRVKLIRFSRNFGQTAAMAAGFAAAAGEVIFPMDADMQNDPKDIPRLLAKLNEGYDVVSGWRKDRKDASLTRKLPSKIANGLIGYVTGVKISDYGCTLKAYRREVLEDVRLYGEMHRFIPAYAAWNGGRVTEMPVAHHPRTVGKSKYGLSRTIKVVLDLLVVKFLTTYMARPIHFFGLIGFVSLGLGMASGFLAVILRLFYDISFIVTPLPLLTVFLTLLGVQFILMGLIAEILVRTYYESQGKPLFKIAEKVNF
ncbi:glycosyltransferase family 2 protein [Candidatus Kaiserbacteria bacterium]|nr:glycosyltransferase family 2 protein [Candidatus Kaiserbacteria bacterium]